MSTARRARLRQWPLGLWLATGLTVQALAAAPAPPSEQQRSTAERVAAAGVPLADLAPDAPATHEVKPGDTLWGLAGLFLKSPWRWPELWGMNLEQLRNPHRILPGQTLVLLKADGRARLVVGADAKPSTPEAGTVQAARPAEPAEDASLPRATLSPRVRANPLPPTPLATLPLKALGPFLSETLVVEPGTLEAAPRLAGSPDGRLLLARGDIAYVEGDLSGSRQWRVFRAPVPLVDPLTGELLGHEARHVGVASVHRLPQRPGQEPAPQALRLTQLRVEASVGDRLLPVGAPAWPNFVPRAPGQPVQARVVSIPAEAMSASQRQLVALNRGVRDGLDSGHVLALWRPTAAPVRAAGERRGAPGGGPGERHGLVMVVRAFEKVSYALVLDTKDPVRVGDELTQP